MKKKVKKGYSIEEVKGNKKLINKLIHLVNNYDKNENEKVLEILEFIEYNNISSLKDLIRFSCLNDTYYIIRKAQNIFVKLIQENQMNNNINNEKIYEIIEVVYNKKKTFFKMFFWFLIMKFYS